MYNHTRLLSYVVDFNDNKTASSQREKKINVVFGRVGTNNSLDVAGFQLLGVAH